jgi:glycosyltransferase involved in cell wall biosynthesis
MRMAFFGKEGDTSWNPNIVDLDEISPIIIWTAAPLICAASNVLTAWERIGDFRTDPHITFDYEYWCRMFLAGASVKHFDVELACFRFQRSQKTGNIERTVEEELRIVKNYIWEPTSPLKLYRTHDCKSWIGEIPEAMLCGRPVLTTDVGGNSEIVEDGVTGFVAAAPTVPSVRDALECAWKRRFELRSLGKNAAKKIRSQIPHDPAWTFADKLKNLYAGQSNGLIKSADTGAATC